MRSNSAVTGVLFLTLGLLSIFESVAADAPRAGNAPGFAKNQSDAVETLVTRTVGWSRYYGNPIYRCRRFSSECYYYRPAHYLRHWSYSYRINSGTQLRGAARPDTHTPKLVHYYIDPLRLTSGIFTKPRNVRNGIYRGQKVTAYEVSGGFARITSPGHAARWVRADSLSADRPDNQPRPDVSAQRLLTNKIPND